MSNGYNTWGGKNNSWGNKNKKNNQPKYQENKAFKIFAICFLGAILVGGGIETITSFLDKADQVNEVVETVDKIKEQTSNKQNTKAKDANVENTSSIELNIDDIKDILEKIDEVSNENSLQAKVEDIVILHYNQINTIGLFTENIIGKLSDYENAVSFAIIMNEINTENDVYTNRDIINQFMQDNKERYRL